jgi:hypothetical protein
MALKYVEARFETGATPGKESGVSASFAAKTIYFPALSFSMDTQPNPLERDDEMRTVNEAIRYEQESFAPTWTMRTRMYPDTFAFMLKAHLGAPVTTAGNGVITDLGGTVMPASTNRHHWDAPYATGAAPQTVMFRVVDPESTMYWDVRGATVESLEIGVPDAGGITVTWSGKANYISNIADPALTPAYESLAIAPFLRAYATLSWLASSANTDTVSWTIGKQVEHTRTFGGASKWPDLVEHGEGVVQLSGTIDKRTINATDWAALIAATRFTSLTTFTHTSFVTGAYPYKVFIQAPNTSASYSTGGPDDIMNRKRTPASFAFRVTRDSAQSAAIEVCNATVSYA